ncbi:MAG: CDP-alcohol phosphatidyltransferase family protein [Alcanivoracaceae bacterium]|nr:CDP-alcohol phosphatidyltransferase family protein [Alcanivoracaceae bacterium]
MADLFIIRLNRVDLLTLSGVLSAGMAVGLALAGQPLLATSLLFVAMLGDALDGIWARKRGITREFGRYLDGFMDMLIYLVGPSLVWYQGLLPGLWGLPLLGLIACGAIRLSVFNQTGNVESTNGGMAYLGLPVFWTVFLLAGSQLMALLIPVSVLRPLMVIILVAMSLAMLWRRPFFKFTALWQILLLTLGGAGLFAVLHVYAGGTL